MRTCSSVVVLAVALATACTRDNEAPARSVSASPPVPVADQGGASRDSVAPAFRVLRTESAATQVGATFVQAPSPPRVVARQTRRAPEWVYDSARGTLAILGSCASNLQALSLPGDSGVQIVGLSRALGWQLRSMEIVVFGRRTPNGLGAKTRIGVDSFFVRASEGVPALDGTLRRLPGGDMLELRDGQRLAIARLPAALSAADGMRVWIAGPLDAPAGGGIINPDQVIGCPE